jgi:hypothetical protein
MGQLIACASTEGVLVATDSRAVLFETFGEERLITLDRVVPVTSRVVLASAGAIEAHELAKDFAAFAKEEKMENLGPLMEAAIPFFTSRYDEILRKMCEKCPPDPIINMYLVLAGYAGNAGHLFVIWDRPQPPKIEYNRVTDVFTLPRRMGLEFKLHQLIKEKAPVAKLAEAAKAGMEKLAGQDQYVGPPYQYVTITAAGIAKA